MDAQQDSAITRLYEQNTLLIAQAGFGKTVVAQSAAQELLADDVLHRVLIVAPLKVCTLTWMNEWEGWSHLRQPGMAIGPADARRAAIEDEQFDIVVINFDNLVWFFDTYGNNHGFDGLIIDEGSKVKAADGAIMKKLHARRGRLKHFVWRCVMSATPVHESGTHIYTQMMIVDQGAALGSNQENFRREYFMQMDFKGYRWDYQPGGRERLLARIADSVFVADTAEYEASLPRVEEVTVPVKMPRAGWDAYDDMATGLITEIDGVKVEAPNLAVMKNKLQQICCGALYKPGTKDALWLHQAKFQDLDVLLGGHDEPFAVIYQYQFELELLRELYPDAGVLADDPEGVEAAWNAGELDLLLLHPQSAGHGLNIQYGGCRMACLSPLWSADQWDQMIRRLRRRGQASDVVWRYTLCVKGSVEDEDILPRTEGKLDAAEAFITHLREHATSD